jgi:hypothetical protein
MMFGDFSRTNLTNWIMTGINSSKPEFQTLLKFLTLQSIFTASGGLALMGIRVTSQPLLLRLFARIFMERSAPPPEREFVTMKADFTYTLYSWRT